uniref:Uncharacterized protein C1orf50 n=1 Tax=Hydra vulgaris TaxID=6087 RepID=T2M5U2_HYDVU
MNNLSMNEAKALARVVEDESCVTSLLVNSRAVNKARPDDLIALATEVQRADEGVRHIASNKLQIIAEQIRFLQEQARRVLEEAKDSSLLHTAKCNFIKKPGTTYHLYERESGVSYFSMLSPKEWSNCPHRFLGSYRLEHDQSWTKEEDIKKKDIEKKIVEDLMNKGGVPSLEYFDTNGRNSMRAIEECT